MEEHAGPPICYRGTLPAWHWRIRKSPSRGGFRFPAEVCRRLGIGPGSVLEWDEEGENIVVRRSGRYASEDIHRAVFPKAPKLRTLAEMKEGIRRHVRERHARR